ncbi:Periplasmic serine endoprotease DegP precursor [Stieleria neptunia]|uniref:Periplasmic serine endoprotease DegP n=1 Tax=Stieleria neptunia TaxID=2527979 RepID=A0A518I3S1_9BACT|nr:trypsin-like peptidase domain-containing protein [Stieleria neptunia]QDV47706.1 Periplasmic serine endoprotease DegP precursor [Stieleria neptunia]
MVDLSQPSGRTRCRVRNPRRLAITLTGAALAWMCATHWIPTSASAQDVYGGGNRYAPARAAQPNATPPRPSTTASIESMANPRPAGATQIRSLRPSLDPSSGAIPTAQSIQARREALFRELADEFNAFDRLGNLVRKVSQLVKPSVIHIEAHKTETNGGQYESYDEAGSGVVIDTADGVWVLTNRHVILGSQPEEILLRSADGRQYHPSRILSDESTDVAVMKVPDLRLPAARTGDSNQVNIGDFTIAIGSPFGLSHSVTFGILSAKGRRDLSLGDQKIDLQDFFQTDAAINPGNSGGPLLNLRGEVIGLNTAIASSSGGSEGIGFAIPINMAVQVADELIRHGRLRRGYLGVTLEPDFTVSDLGPLQAVANGGAKVKGVRHGSPAAKANLQRGDIIVEFNGSQVDNDDHLVAQVGLTPIGSVVPMIIYRDGKRYRTEVQLTDVN